jgi:hypothetical protein
MSLDCGGSGHASYYVKAVSGAVAQLGEHLHGMQGVRGSSPLSSILNFPIREI